MIRAIVYNRGSELSTIEVDLAPFDEDFGPVTRIEPDHRSFRVYAETKYGGEVLAMEVRERFVVEVVYGSPDIGGHE